MPPEPNGTTPLKPVQQGKVRGLYGFKAYFANIISNIGVKQRSSIRFIHRLPKNSPTTAVALPYCAC